MTKTEQLKVPKREINKFVKFYNDLKSNPFLRYFKAIDSIEYNGVCDEYEELTSWFGNDVESLEKARQFITQIKPEWNEMFINVIKIVREEDL